MDHKFRFAQKYDDVSVGYEELISFMDGCVEQDITSGTYKKQREKAVKGYTARQRKESGQANSNEDHAKSHKTKGSGKPRKDCDVLFSYVGGVYTELTGFFSPAILPR